LLFLPFLVNAQILTPVKWSTETKDLGNNEYEISLHAKIDQGWHMYSQNHPGDGIGVPATITFESNPTAELKGKVSESGKLLDKYSELFQQQEKYYENKVTFKQKIKLKEPKETTIKFSAETQVCDAEKCLPPDWQDFTVKITPKKEVVAEEKPEDNKEKEEIIIPTETLALDSVESAQNQLVENT